MCTKELSEKLGGRVKCGDLDWSQAWLVSLGSRVLPLSEGHPTLCQQAKVWGPEATTRWRHNPADGLKASANTPPPNPPPQAQGRAPPLVEEGQCWG